MVSVAAGEKVSGDTMVYDSVKRYVVGIDEVGRGPLAGPITVCATLWLSEDDGEDFFIGIRDSKKLSEKKRIEWVQRAENVRKNLLQYSVCSIDASVIDNVGIISALSRASKLVLLNLSKEGAISHIYSDYGLPIPDGFSATHIVKGDEQNPLIALASIIAKVERDTKMCELSKEFDEYGFERNKGYGTKEHRDAIQRCGVTPHHRKTFLRNIIV